MSAADQIDQSGKRQDPAADHARRRRLAEQADAQRDGEQGCQRGEHRHVGGRGGFGRQIRQALKQAHGEKAEDAELAEQRPDRGAVSPGRDQHEAAHEQNSENKPVKRHGLWSDHMGREPRGDDIAGPENDGQQRIEQGEGRHDGAILVSVMPPCVAVASVVCLTLNKQ